MSVQTGDHDRFHVLDVLDERRLGDLGRAMAQRRKETLMPLHKPFLLSRVRR